jgi:hypothetical protein
MALSTIGTNQIASGAVTVPKVADQVLSNRNIVINGAMNVSQRTGAAVADMGGSAGYINLDRFRYEASGTAGRFTTTQTAVSDLPGFLNCLHLDCTTADTSIAASEILALEHRIEGQNLQQLKKGTSSAESVTVSFYMKTNAAFVFMCVLNDFDNNRVNTQKFTTTTDWTRHSITFVGDTTGALGDDSGNSLSVSIYLHAGSNYTGGTYVANTWQSRAASDNMIAPGIGSFYSSTNNDVKLTGLQMEIGTSATPFEHEDFGTTLAKCQRYFFRFQSDTAYDAFAPAYWLVTTQVYAMYEFPVTMRDQPAMTVSSFTSGDWRIHSNGGDGNLGSLIINRCTPNNVQTFSDQSSNTGTAGYAGAIRNYGSTSPYIEFSAEL